MLDELPLFSTMLQSETVQPQLLPRSLTSRAGSSGSSSRRKSQRDIPSRVHLSSSQHVALAAWEMPYSATILVTFPSDPIPQDKASNDLIGIMSGLLVNPVFVKKFFADYGGADGTTSAIDPSITGISVACLQASAAVGALIAGRLGDIIGRKKCVRIGGLIYFLSAFMQIFAPGFAVFVAGRTIQGLGVGFLSMTVPIIQTEIAAPHRRGLMVGIEYTFLIAGYMLSCWVDYGFNFLLPDKMSWQGPFIVQIALSFILLTMSFFLPETPRWLAKNGFMDEALQTVADLHSNGDTQAEHVQKVFLEIQEAVLYETNLGKSGWLVGRITIASLGT